MRAGIGQFFRKIATLIKESNSLQVASLRLYMFRITVLLILFTPLISCSQATTNVKRAIQLGDSLRFDDAIAVLKSEIKSNPKNGEAYYWLGRYAHYIVYDTRPFVQKSDHWSKQEVLANLKKAIQLNPQLKDAYYFIAVEYGCRAREAIQNNNIKQAKLELTEARKLNAFPEYILEYARSILSSCEANAILFSNQDAAINALMYVQLIENFRKDISVVCVNLLERPFYVKYMRNGIPNEISSLPITWNDNLIMNMYSYFPWTQRNIKIKIAAANKNADTELTMNVKDKYGGQTMWIGTAAILNILENNEFRRPVYCAMPYGDDMFEFDNYLQNEGFVSKFVPYITQNRSDRFNDDKFELTILNDNNYKKFSDIKLHHQPRADYFFVDNRRNLILDYIEFLITWDRKEKAKEVFTKMDSLMPSNLAPLSLTVQKRYDKITTILN